ncbi:MAG: hypothetical protein QM731_09605 [Chitinophagaceae bacterium]
MYNISNDDLVLAALIKQDRSMFEARFSETMAKSENTLNMFTKTMGLVNDYNLEKNKFFWNTARYISIISLDLKVLSKYQAFAETEWEKRLFARQVSLLVYESVNDILMFLGKDFKIVSVDYSDDEHFAVRLNEVRKKLNEFKEKHYKKIKEHRNNAMAHRDKDTGEQLRQIYSISWMDSVNMSSEYDSIINEIGSFLEAIMRKGVTDGEIKFNAI